MQVNFQLHTRPFYPLSRKAESVWELRRKNSVQVGTQDFSFEAEGGDPGAVCNKCLILKIMLKIMS
jgi:hypothetical protein